MKSTTPSRRPRHPRTVKNFSLIVGTKVEFVGVTAQECLAYVKKKLGKDIRMTALDDYGCAQCLDANGTVVARIWD